MLACQKEKKQNKKQALSKRRGRYRREKEGREHLLKPTLSLSEVAPKEGTNVRSFPNVTDAHPSPRLPLDALLRGFPSLARLAYTAHFFSTGHQR